MAEALTYRARKHRSYHIDAVREVRALAVFCLAKIHPESSTGIMVRNGRRRDGTPKWILYTKNGYKTTHPKQQLATIENLCQR
jgi:hypothetical protein